MATLEEVAKRWAAQVGTERPRYIGSTSQNVYVDRDRERLYSYGSHFELGRLVGNRASGFFLLNGDRYSPSTSTHQWMLRGAVAATGIPSAIIPFSALSAAGIDRDSIRPIDVQPERTDETKHRVTVPGLVELGARARAGSFGWSGSAPGQTWNAISATGRMRGPDGAEYTATVYKRRYDYVTNAWVESGDDPPAFYRNGAALRQLEGNTFEYSTRTHFLGACLFSARVQGRAGRAKFISAFDENERRPLYFLAELPRCTARTYAEALDALAPRIVHAALAQGRNVARQGDVFAIPTALDRRALKARGAVFAKRGQLLGTNHEATEVAHVKGAVYARGCLYHAPGPWREPDHARQKMGDGQAWHLVTRNTVPRVRQRQRVSAGRAW